MWAWVEAFVLPPPGHSRDQAAYAELGDIWEFLGVPNEVMQDSQVA